MNQPTTSLQKSIEALRAAGAEGPVFDLPADAIADALATARSLTFYELKDTEQEWLGHHVGPVALAMQRHFEIVINENGPDMANAVLMGSALGSAIVRNLIERGLISVEDSHATATRRGYAQVLIRHDGSNLDEDSLEFVFGKDAAAALTEVKSPVARTTCAVVLAAVMPATIKSIDGQPELPFIN